MPRRLFYSPAFVETTIQIETAATVVGTGILDEQATGGIGIGGQRVYYDHELDLWNEGGPHWAEAGAFAEVHGSSLSLEDELRGQHSGLIGNPVPRSRLSRAARRRPINRWKAAVPSDSSRRPGCSRVVGVSPRVLDATLTCVCRCVCCDHLLRAQMTNKHQLSFQNLLRSFGLFDLKTKSVRLR